MGAFNLTFTPYKNLIMQEIFIQFQNFVYIFYFPLFTYLLIYLLAAIEIPLLAFDKISHITKFLC